MRRTHKEKELSQLQVVLRENKQLKMEVKRLRRELEKFHDYIESVDEAEQESVAQLEAKKKHKKMVDNLPTCPECGSSDMTCIKLGPKNFTICKKCKYRRVAA